MTLTRHGHHIPGSPTDDEEEAVSRARCGGCQICRACYSAWTAFKRNQGIKQFKGEFPMRMGAQARGTNKLTKRILNELMKDLPDEAEIVVTNHPSRDSSSWEFKAEWGQDTQYIDSGTKITNFSSPNPRSTESSSHAKQVNAEYVGPYGVGSAFPGDH